MYHKLTDNVVESLTDNVSPINRQGYNNKTLTDNVSPVSGIMYQIHYWLEIQLHCRSISGTLFVGDQYQSISATLLVGNCIISCNTGIGKFGHYLFFNL